MAIRGRFVWEELMTTDVKSAAAFYSKVGALKTEQAAFDPNYVMFKAANGNMGGIMALPDEAKKSGTPPSWMSYIGTANADETARMAAAAGGKVHKAPWNIADGGRIAILSDPQGALFAIYANPKATAAPPAPQLGHASWHELATSDHAAGFSFYQKLFGWHVVNDMDMGPGMGVYRLFAPEGSEEAMGGMYTKPAQQPGPPAWLPYIKVADVKAATTRATSLGAQIVHGPAEVPGGGWIAMGIDPQGVSFALHATAGASGTRTKTAKSATNTRRKKNAPKSRSNAKPKAPVKKKKTSPTPKPKRKAGNKK